MLTLYMLCICVRLSVHPSVRLSQADIVSKQLNIGLCNQRDTYPLLGYCVTCAQRRKFSDAKDLDETLVGTSAEWGHQIRVEWANMGDC